MRHLTDNSYRYTVDDDGTFHDQVTFAYVSPGVPDGTLRQSLSGSR